jgi:hypothetical protein
MGQNDALRGARGARSVKKSSPVFWFEALGVGGDIYGVGFS